MVTFIVAASGPVGARVAVGGTVLAWAASGVSVGGSGVGVSVGGSGAMGDGLSGGGSGGGRRRHRLWQRRDVAGRWMRWACKAELPWAVFPG